MSSNPFPWPRSRDIHIITLVPAALSFVATALGSYWFFALLRAQRNFRRMLVFLLILADCSKSLWILIFSIAGLANPEGIKSRTAFCQVGGFFLQFSFEACDLAILLLITHVSLQILPPLCIPRSQDGLYQQRHWIIPLSVVLPLVDAAIPFFRMPANPAYVFDGVYCSLFAGPLWLSLVLSWVPRYILWLYLLILLGRLFLYIKSQSYARHRSSICSANSELSTHGMEDCISGTVKETDPAQPDSISTQAPDDKIDPSRQASIAASIRTAGSGNKKPQKQFQTVALYPLFYVLAWSVPFAAQIAAFSASKSINANFGLRAAAVCCVSSLGIVDVVIFCSREKPWRYSLQVRKRVQRSRQSSAQAGANDPEADDDAAAKRPHGGGSDQDRRKALQAYERLALEQAEVLARPKMKRTTPDFNLVASLPSDMMEVPSSADL